MVVRVGAQIPRKKIHSCSEIAQNASRLVRSDARSRCNGVLIIVRVSERLLSVYFVIVRIEGMALVLVSGHMHSKIPKILNQTL